MPISQRISTRALPNEFGGLVTSYHSIGTLKNKKIMMKRSHFAITASVIIDYDRFSTPGHASPPVGAYGRV